MNSHSFHTGYIKTENKINKNFTKKGISAENNKTILEEKSKIVNPKSKIEMAERTGLEPASPYGR